MSLDVIGRQDMSDLRLSDQTLDFTENYHDNGEEMMKTSIQSEINVKLCFWASQAHKDRQGRI